MSAKAQLLTVLGEWVLPGGGEAWTSTLVAALATLGVEERNARAAVARTADDGLLTATRHGRRVRWALSPAGRELLEEGTRRIYRFGSGGGAWSGRWLVVLCPVPEDQRAKRARLRSRLGFEGFGWLGPSVAICPHLEREAAATRVITDLGLGATAVVLRSELAGEGAAASVLERAWDLDALRDSYRSFLAWTEDLHAGGPGGGAPGACGPGAGGLAGGDAAAFAALAALVHAWRRYPFADPELPAELLGPGWPGAAARDRFDDLHAAWAPAAARWWRATESAGS